MSGSVFSKSASSVAMPGGSRVDAEQEPGTESARQITRILPQESPEAVLVSRQDFSV